MAEQESQASEQPPDELPGTSGATANSGYHGEGARPRTDPSNPQTQLVDDKVMGPHY